MTAAVQARPNLPEAERNRLLRRIDWRFLLPDPAPRRVACFAGGEIAASLRLVSEEVGSAGGECDLAVVVNPGAGDVRAAYCVLRPGGSFYGEWYSPLAGGPADIRRRLEHAGFADVRCYWPWPWPAGGATSFWLPLDNPRALQHFLRTRPRPHGRLLRLAYLLRRTAWRVMVRGELALPVCVTARRRDGLEAAAHADLLGRVQDSWSEWGLGPTPARLSWLLLTGGFRSVSKLVGLVFADADPDPRIAVKLPRTAEAAAGLRKEADVLRSLQSLPAVVQRGAPRLLFLESLTDTVAAGETAHVGVPLFTRLRPATYRALALQATEWLAGLAGSQPPSSWPDGRSRYVDPVFDQFVASFGSVASPSDIRRCRDLMAVLDRVPTAFEHRDYSPWNVLIDASGQLVVLDWEGAEPDGLAGLDLVYFLTYFAFFHDCAIESGAYRESYRRLLDPSSFTGRVAAECCRVYASRAGFDPVAFPALRLLTWMLHSQSEYRRLVEDAAGPPSAGALRRALFLGLWQEELAAIPSTCP